MFKEFLKVRGADVKKKNEDDAEENVDSTQVLLDALDDFKGTVLQYYFLYNLHSLFRRKRTFIDFPRIARQLETD